MAVAVRGAKKGVGATKRKTRVAVVMGGASAERDVSLESGRAVMESLRGAGVEAYPYDPSALGIGELMRNKPSTAFLAVHGGGGEDGTLQRRLDALGIRYTGSGPEASALAMDKELTKRAFCRRGIPTPPYRVIQRRSLMKAEDLCRDLDYPLVVKPASEGSSLGVSIADSKFDLRKGLDKAFRFGPRAIVESYVGGREFCIGILGRQTLPTVEVVFADDFFSYHAKYQDPRTAYIFDHGLPHRIARSMEAYALAACDTLGCRHYARVDMILSFGDLTPYVLEVNTLPGMTAHSLLPMAAKRCGLTFTDLCLRILELAGEKGL